MRSRQSSHLPTFGLCRRFPELLAAMAIAFAVIGVNGCSGGHQPGQSPPTPEEKAYLQNIQFGAGRVEAAKNFLNHTVTTFHSEVTNKGNKTVVSIDVNLTFSNIEGKPVETKQAYPVSGNRLPLKPGETRAFQVSFDEVPPLWNQAPPQVTPVRVILAGDE